jgi:hypothetical protein
MVPSAGTWVRLGKLTLALKCRPAALECGFGRGRLQERAGAVGQSHAREPAVAVEGDFDPAHGRWVGAVGGADRPLDPDRDGRRAVARQRAWAEVAVEGDPEISLLAELPLGDGRAKKEGDREQGGYGEVAHGSLSV